MSNRIADSIHEMADRNKGRITPEEVVEAAREAGHPLHDQFDWDDSTAAHKFRIEQARSLIRSVTVTIKTETVSVSTVAYVRDPSADSREQGYVSVQRIRKREDDCRNVLLSEFARVNAHLARAKDLAAVFGLDRDVDDIHEKVKSLNKKALDAQPTETMAAA